MRPYGRTITHMPFWIEIFGRISSERLVSVDAEINYLGALDFSTPRHSPASATFAALAEHCELYHIAAQGIKRGGF